MDERRQREAVESDAERRADRTVLRTSTSEVVTHVLRSATKTFRVDVEHVSTQRCWQVFVEAPESIAFGASASGGRSWGSSTDRPPARPTLEERSALLKSVADLVAETAATDKAHDPMTAIFEVDNALFDFWPASWNLEPPSPDLLRRPPTTALEDPGPDPESAFADASFARVTLPIRPGMEGVAMKLLGEVEDR